MRPTTANVCAMCANRWRALRRGCAPLGMALLCWLLVGCASLDEWQRNTLYRPTPVASAGQWQQMLAQRPELQAITVSLAPVDGSMGTDDEQVQLLRWPAVPGQRSAVRVLFLHGTFRHAFQNLAKAAPMHRAGLDVYLLDYRGWGASSPRVPDEASIHEDAWAAWQTLQSAQRLLPPEPGVRWVVYGHSMGSAVAVRLAERLTERLTPPPTDLPTDRPAERLSGQGAVRAAGRDPKQAAYCALVLESAFTRFADVAGEAAGWLGRGLTALGNERMDSAGHIARVDPPVWFLHGSLDRTVPVSLGRALFELAPQPKHWAEWPLGHSNLQTDPSGRYDAVWREIAQSCRTPSRH